MNGGYDFSGVEVLSSWVLDKLRTETEESIVKLVKVLWGIWFARNKRIWEEKIIAPQVIMEVSSRMVTEWQFAQEKAQCGMQTGVNKRSRAQVKWEPPDSEWHKINVDAAIHEGDSFFKVGMIMRDENGTFEAGMQRSIGEEVTILEAEAIGVLEALCWITRLGIRNVIVECDSLTVVNALGKNTHYVSEVGITLEGCRSLLMQRSDLKVQYVRRQANSVAHNLARLPCLLGTMNYFSSPPPCVLEYIVAEYSF